MENREFESRRARGPVSDAGVGLGGSKPSMRTESAVTRAVRTRSADAPLHHSARTVCRVPEGVAPRVGLEPTTLRLTAACSTIELSGIEWAPKTTHERGQVKVRKGARLASSDAADVD